MSPERVSVGEEGEGHSMVMNRKQKRRGNQQWRVWCEESGGWEYQKQNGVYARVCKVEDSHRRRSSARGTFREVTCKYFHLHALRGCSINSYVSQVLLIYIYVLRIWVPQLKYVASLFNNGERNRAGSWRHVHGCPTCSRRHRTGNGGSVHAHVFASFTTMTDDSSFSFYCL